MPEPVANSLHGVSSGKGRTAVAGRGTYGPGAARRSFAACFAAGAFGAGDGVFGAGAGAGAGEGEGEGLAGSSSSESVGGSAGSLW